MFAESNMRPCYFRYGYDIALPLRARAFFYSLRNTPPDKRKYFATFKVSRAAYTCDGFIVTTESLSFATCLGSSLRIR